MPRFYEDLIGQDKINAIVYFLNVKKSVEYGANSM